MSSDSDRLLKKSLTELFQLANRDGILTFAEMKIIDQIEIDVKKYVEILNIALEDGVVDDLEHKILQDFAEKIKKNAVEAAVSDGVYSKSEKDLIVKLNKVMHKYFEI